MLDFVTRVNKKYYPQTLLEECKYVIRKNKVENLINDDLDESDIESDFLVILIILIILFMSIRPMQIY